MQNIIKNIQFTCPVCGKKGDFTLYRHIDVGSNPDIKDKVLNGDIFKYHCKGCGINHMVRYPVTYYEFSKKHILFLGRAKKEVAKACEEFNEWRNGESSIKVIKLRATTSIDKFLDNVVMLYLNDSAKGCKAHLDIFKWLVD